MTQEEDPQERFLVLFKQEKYRARLASLEVEKAKTITVNFTDIAQHDYELAAQLVNNPDEGLEHAKNAALYQLKIEAPEYSCDEINVRITSLFQLTPLREIGSSQIGKLLMVSGIVMRASQGKPRIIKACFQCRSCGTRQIVDQEDPSASFLRKPLICVGCEKKAIFDYVEEECTFIDEQEIWVQERPDELPPGQMPQTLHTKLQKELVNTARPGDSVLIVGIARSLPKKVKGGTLNTVDLFIEVNSIKLLGKDDDVVLDSENTSQIQTLAKEPNIHQKIINSIAPSIHGNDEIKEAIMYLLFGGVPKETADIKIRGEINVLLMGDPGTAKTQMLKYVSRLAHRGIFTSGKGTTGVGLTAAVIKDPDAGYTLEAGALVLADHGVACIDEFDKMGNDDRNNIHEPLEQHTVSVAKAGIIATLNARCAVLAAANPVLGRYNPFTSIIENISFPVTLLSRFDLIFLMRDVPDVKTDTLLAKHILEIHAGKRAVPVIDQKVLRRYISYARTLNPQLTREAGERILQFYLQMRKASETEGSLAIGSRQLEALTRLSEARARACLRGNVLVEDAEAAIRIMTRSLEEVGIDLSSGKVDIDILLTGKPKSVRDKISIIISCIVKMEQETGIVEKEALLDTLGEVYGMARAEAQQKIQQLLHNGTLFEPREGCLKKT